MLDLDNLIVTFQTQLSDVMETLVKTAMYEVTKLVEDSFLEEVRRRKYEVESLRMKLQWTERKLGDRWEKEGVKTGKCVNFSEDVVGLSTEEERHQEVQDDTLKDCSVKKEVDYVGCTKSSRCEIQPKSTRVHTPEGYSQAMVKEDRMPAVDLKEAVNKTCSSVHVEGWCITFGGEAGSDSHNAGEMMETHPDQTQETNKNEEILRSVIKQDPQITTVDVFPEDQGDSHMPTDPSLLMDSNFAGLTHTTAGLLHNPRLRTNTDFDPNKAQGSLKRTEHELSKSIIVDIQGNVSTARDKLSSSEPAKARLKNSDSLNVSIKPEVIVDSDGYDNVKHLRKKHTTKLGMTAFSCLVKRNRVRLEALTQNQNSHKAMVHKVMKLHSNVDTGLRLQAAIQHLHRPMKKPTHTLLNSSTAAMSIAHSQVMNLNPLNRIPSPSKTTPSPTLSVPRVHLSDKQTTDLNQIGIPCVNNRSLNQSGNQLHIVPLLHPDSHPVLRHPLHCGQCGKCFPHPSNLKAHLQTHTGERPFCCSLCSRSFTKLSNLKAHRRVHTGERPYCCLACGKRFTQKCNLKRHQRIHLDG